MIISKFEQSGGHWYTRDGDPAYTQTGLNGKDRPTTMRDARKKDLVPSVTTVTGVTAKPGLNIWMQRQVLLSALTMTRNEGEDDDSYISRIIKDSQESSRSASAEGTRIHNAIEHFYEQTSYPDAYAEHVTGATDVIKMAYGERTWIPERSFAHEMGFGGRVDLHTEGIVLDVKTKDFESESEIVNYDENMMQLAAYRVGLGMPKAVCANVFVSRSRPGLACIQEWTEDDMEKGWRMFCHLLSFWQLKNDHQ